jgi:hypothetical protein
MNRIKLIATFAHWEMNCSSSSSSGGGGGGGGVATVISG